MYFYVFQSFSPFISISHLLWTLLCPFIFKNNIIFNVPKNRELLRNWIKSLVLFSIRLA